jgi:hypothetical protein
VLNYKGNVCLAVQKYRISIKIKNILFFLWIVSRILGIYITRIGKLHEKWLEIYYNFLILIFNS